STCTATVADTDSGTSSRPSGTVSFSSRSEERRVGRGSCPLPATLTNYYSVTYTPAAGSEGPHHITGAYGGDGDHSGSAGADTVTATERTSGTTVVCAPHSVAVTSASTCTATVSDTDSGTSSRPSGTVSFSSDASGTFSSRSEERRVGTESNSCSFTYTPAADSEGPHHITGAYGGDGYHSGSAGSGTVNATKRPQSTLVVYSRSSVSLTAPSTCTATVSDTDSGTSSRPSGTVSFSSDASGTFSS